MKKGFNALQIILFAAGGALLFIILNLIFPYTGKEFGSVYGPTILKVVFASATIGVGILFGSPGQHDGGLKTQTYSNTARWIWALAALAGAVIAAGVYLM